MGPKQPVAGPSRIKANATQAPPPPASVAAFNPSRTLFACAQPVLGSADKLTVWDIIADRVIAEWEVEGAAKATTVSWGSISSGAARKKRKKKSNANGDGDEDVVALTTDKGGLVIFAPRRGEVIRRLDVGRVHAVASDDRLVLVTAKEVLVIDSDLSAVSHTFALPAGTPAPTSASLLPTSTADVLHLLIASASVLALHLNVSTGKVTHTSAPLPVSTTSVSSLVSLPSSPQGASFLVVSADDRSVSQYTLSTPTAAAKLSYRYASPTLSPVHSVTCSSDLLSVLHSSGEISLFTLPKELDFARPKSDSKPSLVRLVEGKEDRPVRLAGVSFVEEGDAPGSLLCGRLFGGGRVKWVKAVYELPEGGLKAETVVKTDAQDLVGAAATQNSIPMQRFSAPSTTVEIPAEEEESAPALPADVDAADLSLGERLLALPTTESATPAKALPTLDGPVNAASLTRLLVQALHTSDPALLTLCLSHRDPALIRNTIRKMPTQLALPLLKACVERLGQGKGSGKRGGGRGVAANEQQGRGTVEWVKGVLVERGSILMTMPSLPVHLATLSSLLQTRMQLYQPLLSLSGRLDLALAQISMRRLAAEASAYAESKGEGAKYIEGESDDEDSDDDEVHVEIGDEDGEIEDVDMMDRSDDDSEEDDSEDEDSDPLESESEDGGFLDLEAEESGSGDEESDEE